jgi:5-enolpyruvylshikimate-3-phosphate synthase
MFAEGKTIVRDAKELRYKESDRISLLLSNIKSFNPDIGIKEFDDGFEIEPAEDKNMGIVKIKTGGDHRIAMSFMVASLRSGKKVEFDDMECVETSFPGFFNLIEKWYQ